jgi:hypothetical protein
MVVIQINPFSAVADKTCKQFGCIKISKGSATRWIVDVQGAESTTAAPALSANGFLLNEPHARCMYIYIYISASKIIIMLSFNCVSY